jgi:hypothetical protein
MMYRLSNRSKSRLEGLDITLIKIISEGISNCPFDFGIPEDGGLRTDDRQKQLYAKGRTTEELEAKEIFGIEGEPEERKITWTLNSLHKASEDGTGKAFDIYAYVGGRASWDNRFLERIARHLQKIAKENYGVELQWGFDLWGKDGAHFQIK